MLYSRQDIFMQNQGFNDFDSLIFSKKKIVIIGAGGIGSVLSELLVRGGFTNLCIIDSDIIDLTNLQRQIYFKEDIGKPKVKALKDHLKKINPNTKIENKVSVLNKGNANTLLSGYDLIIDATDNFQSRKIINDFCILNKCDWIFNAAVKAQIMSCIFYATNNSFDLVFKNHIKDTSCCEVGVLASTTFIAGSIAYNNVLKYFLKINENVLIKFDIWNYQLHKINLE